jgi:(p)ppGpp synthase/HD superfamily hydrolase
MSEVIKEARDFAITAHWGQMYGSKPYYFHLDRVAEIARHYNLPEEIIAAAYMHDVVEDTKVTANEVFDKFGYEIATLVYAVTDEESDLDFDFLIKKDGLTERQAKDAIRKDKKKKTYPKILAHPYGVFLKLCDRLANVECSLTSKDTRMIDKYREEQPGFKEKLFTPGVASNMWSDLENLMKGN